MVKAVLGETRLLSTKRASELTGYSQDYLGQLCRAGTLDCKFIGRQWYVEESSIKKYAPSMKKPKQSDYLKITQDKQAPSQAKNKSASNAHKKTLSSSNKKGAASSEAIKSFSDEQELISIKDLHANLVEVNGKVYVSSKEAARITGYSMDYIGQLARSKSIPAIKAGKRWYVSKKDLLQHKKQKDEMLARVQAESVGMSKKINNQLPNSKETSLFDIDLGVKYKQDADLETESDLLSRRESEFAIPEAFAIRYVPESSGSFSAGSHYSGSVPISSPVRSPDLSNLSSQPRFTDVQYEGNDYDMVSEQTKESLHHSKRASHKAIHTERESRPSLVVSLIKLLISIIIFVASLMLFVFALSNSELLEVL